MVKSMSCVAVCDSNFFEISMRKNLTDRQIGILTIVKNDSLLSNRHKTQQMFDNAHFY